MQIKNFNIHRVEMNNDDDTKFKCTDTNQMRYEKKISKIYMNWKFE